MSKEPITVSPTDAPPGAPTLTVRTFKTTDYREPDAFEGPKLKIERAKRHISDFRNAFKTLSGSNVMRIEPYVDPETGCDAFKIWQAQPLPSDLRLTAADALYNLRSALDQAVCSCARLANKSPDGTYFPHGANKQRFEISLREKCEKVPVPVCAAIAALEPYHGGNGYLLRTLHDLNIIDKHRDLIAIHPMIRQLAIGEAAFGGPAKNVIPNQGTWRRTEDKFELVDAGTLDIRQQVNVTIAITFGEVEAIEGQSVIQVLFQTCDLVERTVAIIEKAMSEVSAGLSGPG